MRHLTALAVSLALVSLGPGDAHARKKQPAKFVVLVRLENPVPAAWEKEIQSAALAATTKANGIEWLPPPQVSLEETRMLIGCDSWSADCVGAIGETLGAKRVLYVEVVHPSGQQPTLTLMHVTVKRPGRAVPLKIALPNVEDTGLTATKAFVRGVVVNQVPAVVVLNADVPNTTVYMDGQKVGVAPLVLSEGLKPGQHDLMFEKEGYQTVERRIEVKRARLLNVQVVLPAAVAAVAPPTPPPTPADPPPGDSKPVVVAPADEASYPHFDAPVAWTGVGLGALGVVAGGVLLGMHYAAGAAANEAYETGAAFSFPGVNQKNYEQAIGNYHIGAMVAFGVGAVFAGVGGAFFFLPPPESE